MTVVAGKFRRGVACNAPTEFSFLPTRLVVVLDVYWLCLYVYISDMPISNPNILRRLNRKGRQSTRHKGHGYRYGWFFVTIDVLDKRPLFGNIKDGVMHLNECGRIADLCWQKIPEHFPNAILDEYQIMPEHLHGVLHLVKAGKNPEDNGDNFVERGQPRRGVACNAPTGLPLSHQTWGLEQVHVIDENNCDRLPLTDRQGKILKGPKPGSLGSIIRSYKSAVTNKINELRKTPGDSHWQRNFHDHIIQNEAELKQIRRYIRENPKNYKQGY